MSIKTGKLVLFRADEGMDPAQAIDEVLRQYNEWRDAKHDRCHNPRIIESNITKCALLVMYDEDDGVTKPFGFLSSPNGHQAEDKLLITASG